MEYRDLDSIFHPRSIALVGITTTDPEHWTRTFLDSLLEFNFQSPFYLVNPKGGEIKGLKVYPSLKDIPENIDYVIGLVAAPLAPQLVKESASKGVKAIHFCTAGFSETGEEEGERLEKELIQVSREEGIRIIGPNCMGIYSPQSRISFSPDFPKEGGTVGFISQSGGNAFDLIRKARLRGVRFSKVVSYGNACDLDESDFLEYLADDPDTGTISLYIEGVKNGRKFRGALEKAAREKPVILLKGGITEAGTRAVAGHTGALAGAERLWDSVCKQLGVIRAYSIDELVDLLVTFSFMPRLKGNSVALVGTGGGASVLITDECEKRGLRVPPLPQGLRSQMREYIQDAGNILRNPIDYSQVEEPEKLNKIIKLLSEWERSDFLIGFIRPGQTAGVTPMSSMRAETLLKALDAASKPVAIVFEPESSPEGANESFSNAQKFVTAGLPVYYSFAGAANAINSMLSYYDRHKEIWG